MGFKGFIIKTALKTLGLDDVLASRVDRIAKIVNGSKLRFSSKSVYGTVLRYVDNLINLLVLQQGWGRWILPYWAEKQLDPSSEYFVPSGHAMDLPNLSLRNWVAVGTPSQTQEMIVDPRGAVTPWKNGWSVDVWVNFGEPVYPSRLDKGVSQKLVENVPVCETVVETEKVRVVEKAFGEGWYGFLEVEVCPKERAKGKVAIVVRPFNPNAVANVERIEVVGNVVYINGRKAIRFSGSPRVLVWNMRYGDIDRVVWENFKEVREGKSEDGLLTCALVYDVEAEESPEKIGLGFSLSPDVDPPIPFSVALERVIGRWKDALRCTARMETEKRELADIFEAFKAFLLLLIDGDGITAGPFSYHEFWYRDATYAVMALLKIGAWDEAKAVLRGFLSRQRRDGAFISQDGEWDSPGQALFSFWKYYEYTQEKEFMEDVYPNLVAGADWLLEKIGETENEDALRRGLLPAGISAEHFGVPDFYYWDNFWAVGGLSSLAKVAAALGKKADAERFANAAKTLMKRLRDSILKTVKMIGLEVLPSAPLRGGDGSIVGTLVSVYPLELWDPNDTLITKTLSYMERTFFYDGMFYLPIKHTGLNFYLSLQVAQVHLRRGEKGRANAIFSSVLKRIGPPYWIPEAVHPRHNGGTMGDCPHTWAMSEFINFVADSLILGSGGELTVFPGLPALYNISLEGLRTPFGEVNLALKTDREKADLYLKGNFHRSPKQAFVEFPGSRVEIPGELKGPFEFHTTVEL